MHIHQTSDSPWDLLSIWDKYSQNATFVEIFQYRWVWLWCHYCYTSKQKMRVMLTVLVVPRRTFFWNIARSHSRNLSKIPLSLLYYLVLDPQHMHVPRRHESSRIAPLVVRWRYLGLYLYTSSIIYSSKSTRGYLHAEKLCPAFYPTTTSTSSQHYRA